MYKDSRIFLNVRKSEKLFTFFFVACKFFGNRFKSPI